MSTRADIARLEEENRKYKAMLEDTGSINPQEVKKWHEIIERNLVSIERAKAGTE